MRLSRRGFIQGTAAAGAMAATALAGSASAAEAAGGEGAAGGEAAGSGARMLPGTYFGKGAGMSPVEPVRVKVEVDEDSILSIEVVDKQYLHEQPRMLESVELTMIPRMLEAQSFSVDAATGATASSFAVMAAVRDAVEQAYVAGGADASAAERFDVEVPDEGGSEELSYDVVVCGMGGAGIAAAMTAVDEMAAAGLPVSVLGIETAAKCGGACANTGEIFSLNPQKNIDFYNGGQPWEDEEALYEDWIASFSDGTPCKPEVVRAFLDASGEATDWLIGHGFFFSEAKKGFGDSHWLVKLQYLMRGNRDEEKWDYKQLYPTYDEHYFGGQYINEGQYFDTIMRDYEEAGGQLMLETECTDLIFDDSGAKVVGVRARDNVTGKEYTVHAKSVIMCTGGFLANPEMTEKYMDNPAYPFAGAWSLYGMRQCKGTLIESAIEQGVGTYNIDMPPITHSMCTPSPIRDYPIRFYDGLDARYLAQNSYTLNDLLLILGKDGSKMQVLPDGLRHSNESALFSYWVDGPVCYTVMGEDYIADIAANGLPGDPGTYTTTKYGGQGGYVNATPIPQLYEVIQKGVDAGYVFRGDTLAELAEAAGLPVDAFVQQAEDYRGYCESGVDEQFGKAAEKMPQTIGYNGPYYAIKMNIEPYATCGALDVDQTTNALLADGTPVDGLYACGNDSGGVIECNMKPYAQYGGVAQGWAYTSGRIAGKQAVAKLLA